MKVTKGVIWALAGVLTLGAVLGGGPVWTAALAHAGEEPPSSAVPAVPGKGVPEQLALALGGPGGGPPPGADPVPGGAGVAGLPGLRLLLVGAAGPV